jgi:cytochrome c biogenesis protein CcmG, thiol:disulfide interchange protein DsbE
MPFNRRTFQLTSIAFLMIGLVWISYSKTNPAGTAQDLTSAAQKGFLAPDFETTTLSGETIKLSSLRGHPVILNLWASWCPPCREEMPALQQIYKDYSDQGLVVLGAHMTAQDSREAAASFVDEMGLSFLIPLDPKGEISRLYHVQALPTTYFIDKDGIIRDLIIGGPVADAVFRAQAQDLIQAVP